MYQAGKGEKTGWSDLQEEVKLSAEKDSAMEVSEECSDADFETEMESDAAVSYNIQQPWVMSWGRSDFGTLLKRTDEDVSDGLAVYHSRGQSIISIASNVYHTVSVTATGEVYICGQNDQGQISDDISVTALQKPVILDALSSQRVVSAACGQYHTCVVTASGCAMSFGGNESGQLGHTSQKLSHVGPKVVHFSLSNTRTAPLIVTKAACGDFFSLFLTTSGEVFGCGSAEFLGNSVKEGRLTVTSAERVEALASCHIRDIAAGASHVLALSTSGELYSWGSNKHCQLGFDSTVEHEQLPRSVPLDLTTSITLHGPPSTSPVTVVGMAAGYAHSVLWTSHGELFGAGHNKYGQLAVPLPRVTSFQRISLSMATSSSESSSPSSSSTSLSVIMAACGAQHTLVLCAGNDGSVSRALGLTSLASRALSRGLSMSGMSTRTDVSSDAVSAQSDTVVLGFGLNTHNQVTGAQSASTVSMCRSPVIVQYLSNRRDETLFVAAGGDQSFAIVQSLPDTAPSTFVSTSSTVNKRKLSRDPYSNPSLRKQFSTMASKATVPVSAQQMLALIQRAASDLDVSDGNALRNKPEAAMATCMSTVCEIFGAPSLLAASFTKSSETQLLLDTEGLEAVYVSLLRLPNASTVVLPRLFAALLQTLTQIERFVQEEVKQEPGVSSLSRSAMQALRVVCIIWQSPLMGETMLSVDLYPRLLRVLHNLLLPSPTSISSSFVVLSQIYPAHVYTARLVRPLITHIDSLIRSLSSLLQQQQIQPLQAALIRADRIEHETKLQRSCEIAQMLFHEVSSQHTNKSILGGDGASHATVAVGSERWEVPVEAFHSTAAAGLTDPALLMDALRHRDYTRLRQQSSQISQPQEYQPFFLRAFAYFLYSPQVKKRLLLAEASLQQQRALEQHAMLTMYTAQAQQQLRQQQQQQSQSQPNQPMQQEPPTQVTICPFLVLSVERSHLLAQTQLALQPFLSTSSDVSLQSVTSLELQKPLKVVFLGEEGVDEGGVRREFFQLLLQQVSALDYGLFTVTPSERCLYLNRDYAALMGENMQDFEFVGLCLALALYNDVRLDLRLPRIFYRLLLHLQNQQPLSTFVAQLDDLLEVDLALHQGLSALLQYEPAADVEDIFCRSFCVEHVSVLHDPAHPMSVNLIEGGSEIPVTGANREDYVQRYVRWLLVDSVAQQIEALARGFRQVFPVSGQLSFLSAHELQLLLAGTPHLDFHALQRTTQYIGDSSWTPEQSPVLGWLWQTLHSLSLEDKQRFLRFVTGSSQAPIGGLASVELKVQRMGPDSNSLPTAHTCFNTLLLPEYSSEEKLRERLRRAIFECEGFGLK